MDKRSVRRLLRLGFLSPRIIEAIADGHQPPDFTVFSLMRRVDLPLLWKIVSFLARKWTRELDYRLIKELWAFTDNRIAGAGVQYRTRRRMLRP
jgi:hypothetical protein